MRGIDDVTTDLENHHIEGFAVHGHTPFSMPLISHITDDLWTGGCRDGLPLPHDFRYVVSLYPWERYELGPQTERLELALFDADEPLGDGEVLFESARWARDALDDGKKTLIHCQAGLNRSSLVAGLTLVLGGMSPRSAIELLRERRSSAVLCNPTFERWLLAQQVPPPA